MKTTASSPADRKVHGESGSRASCKINTRASVPSAPTAPPAPVPPPKRRRGGAEPGACTLLGPSEVMGTREELWIRPLSRCGTIWQRFCHHLSRQRGTGGFPGSLDVPRCFGGPSGVSGGPQVFRSILGCFKSQQGSWGSLVVLGGPWVFWSIPRCFTGQWVSWGSPKYLGEFPRCLEGQWVAWGSPNVLEHLQVFHRSTRVSGGSPDVSMGLLGGP